MKKSKSIEGLKNQQDQLKVAEMKSVKGGWTITCEEKRGLFGITYQQWGLKWDGSLLGLKMQQP